MTEVRIEIEGLDRLMIALQKFPREVSRYLIAAGREASERVILDTQGLKTYPPSTAANRPGRMKTVYFPSTGRTAEFRMSYYERNRGTWLPVRGGGWRNLGNSQRLKDQFYTKRISSGYAVEIGNRSTYARYVVGEQQPSWMATIGWRRLIDVVRDKMPEIRDVYQRKIDLLLFKLRL